MPTDEATVVTDPTPSTDAPAEVLNHPAVQKLQEELSQAKQREAAARKGMDEANIKVKRLKEIVEPLEEKEEETKSEVPFVTKDELWEVTHKKELELYADDEYKADIGSGIPREYALKTAKLRHSVSPDTARKERLATLSAPIGSGRDLAGEDDIVLTEEQKKRGITKEMIKKYRDM